MRCNSCQFEISPADKSMECEVCGKPIHTSCAIHDNDLMMCDLCFVKKGEKGNFTDGDLKVPDVIRRSYIQLYQTCPFKFFNQVILGHDMPPTIYTQLGIDLHDLFDYANTRPDFTQREMIEAIYEVINMYPDDLFVENMGRNEAILRAKDSIETYYHVTKDMPEPFASEQTIQFSVGEDLPIVQATSDRINKVDGMLQVMDWKTGGVMVGKQLSSDLQAPLYIHSIREKYDMEVSKFTFYYLKDNKERTFEMVDRDRYVCRVGKREYFISIPDAIKKVQRTFSLIKQGEFSVPFDSKKMYYHCKVCHIRELGLCEGADIQIWNQYNK